MMMYRWLEWKSAFCCSGRRESIRARWASQGFATVVVIIIISVSVIIIVIVIIVWSSSSSSSSCSGLWRWPHQTRPSCWTSIHKRGELLLGLMQVLIIIIFLFNEQCSSFSRWWWPCIMMMTSMIVWKYGFKLLMSSSSMITTIHGNNFSNLVIWWSWPWWSWHYLSKYPLMIVTIDDNYLFRPCDLGSSSNEDTRKRGAVVKVRFYILWNLLQLKQESSMQIVIGKMIFLGVTSVSLRGLR